jgi:hypothetical protein
VLALLAKRLPPATAFTNRLKAMSRVRNGSLWQGSKVPQIAENCRWQDLAFEHPATPLLRSSKRDRPERHRCLATASGGTSMGRLFRQIAQIDQRRGPHRRGGVIGASAGRQQLNLCTLPLHSAEGQHAGSAIFHADYITSTFGFDLRQDSPAALDAKSLLRLNVLL